MTIQIPRPTRFVVLHRPGPKWKPGVDFRGQDGVEEHVKHYRKLYEQDKLQMGGPFLEVDAGGMMITSRDVSREEIEAFAAADPAVISGLLTCVVLPWMTAMERD